MLDVLNVADMTTIRDWANAGGNLIINDPDSGTGVSAFGTFLGAQYAFTSVAEPDGDTTIVTDATHRLLTTPNVLDNTALSNWGSSSHGAFNPVGSAYSCIADDTDGMVSEPVLCATPYGNGAIILTGLDPECDCHDDHLAAGTNAGSETFENYFMLLFTQ